MKRKALLISLLLVFTVTIPFTALSGDSAHNKKLNWSFDGMFGKVDKQSAQRGLQVYKEVCASCHGLKRVAYRNLSSIGFSENEIKTLAADVLVIDGPNGDGDMFERPGRPSDRFVSPFPNDNAAKSANGGALPPDLSLMTKARADGPNYVYSLLTGYEEAPSGVKIEEGLSYNKYFPGNQIAMAPPLSDGMVEYMDGTDATTDQMARDVVNYLQWAAEPEMEQRKSIGIRVMLFLLLIAVLFYFAKIRTWAEVKK